MTTIIGKLSDIYGKKKILVVAIIICSLGTLLIGLSIEISTMLVARIM
jgi:MFS family permease